MTVDHVMSEFTVEHAFAFIQEVSGDAHVAEDSLAAFVGDPRSGDGNQSRPVQKLELGEFISASLGAAGVVVSVDWAEGLSHCREAFVELFSGIGIDASGCGSHLLTMKEPLKGEAPGLAYLEFRELAEAHGLCVLDLNEGSDAYQFFLVPTEVALRWAGVRIDDVLKVWAGDQVFAGALRGVGLQPNGVVESGDREPPDLSVGPTVAPGI